MLRRGALMGARIHYFLMGLDQGELVIYLVFPLHIRLFILYAREDRLWLGDETFQLHHLLTSHILLHFSHTYLLRSRLTNVSYYHRSLDDRPYTYVHLVR